MFWKPIVSTVRIQPTPSVQSGKTIAVDLVVTHEATAAVTGDGANIVPAGHRTDWKHHPRFAHTSTFGVKDWLKVPEVFQLLEKCTGMVSFSQHSTEATEKLRHIQRHLKA